MLKNNPPKAILFDWDNTLVDSSAALNLAKEIMLDTMGRDKIDPKKIKEVAHLSARDALTCIFGDEWKKAETIYRQAYKDHQFKNLTLKPFVCELLDYIKNKKIYMAIVSNKRGDNLRKEIDFFGLDKYFNKTVGSLDTEFDKPHKLPALYALEGSGIGASDAVWFVGDSIVDIECAINSGCRPILFYNEGDHPISIDKTITIVHSHTELLTEIVGCSKCL